TPIETSSYLVEIQLSLFLAQCENALQIHLVRVVLSQLLCAPYRDTNKFFGYSIPVLEQAIVGPLAFPSRLHQSILLQLSKVCGDARLAQLCNLLELVYGEFILLQKGDQAQAGGVREDAQVF